MKKITKFEKQKNILLNKWKDSNFDRPFNKLSWEFVWEIFSSWLKSFLIDNGWELIEDFCPFDGLT